MHNTHTINIKYNSPRCPSNSAIAESDKGTAFYNNCQIKKYILDSNIQHLPFLGDCPQISTFSLINVKFL